MNKRYLVCVCINIYVLKNILLIKEKMFIHYLVYKHIYLLYKRFKLKIRRKKIT